MIYQRLKSRAVDAPEHVAVCAAGRGDLTYRMLIRQMEVIGSALIARGIHADDAVAVVLPNGPDMAVALLGTAAAAICAPLNPNLAEDEYDFYFTDMKPTALIAESGMKSQAIEVAKRRGIALIELTPTPGSAAGVFTIPGAEPRLASDITRRRSHDCALLLHTSGTTSRPKMVPLTHANLLASAKNIGSTLSLTQSDRCLNVMPLFHIHGIVGALLSSLIAGGSVVCTSGFHSHGFFSWLEHFRPTWYTAVPTIHHAVLSAAEANRNLLTYHSLRFIRSSSSALPVQVMEGLEKIFKVPVIESYGMTEAAHQMASNPLPPKERKRGSVGMAAGPEIAIMDETGKLVARGETGEIVIHGANVMCGYANYSDANLTSFTQGWFRTGDQGCLDKDGYLFVTGRIKEIINRGGEKISPREVDDVILKHPEVEQAVTFAVPHPTLGEDIAAAIVLRPQSQTSVHDLRQFAAGKLAGFKVPTQIVLVDKIPNGPTGKVSRVGLAQQLGLCPIPESAPGETHSLDAPQTDTELSLAGIWQSMLGQERMGRCDNFFRLGGDSLIAARIISRIQRDLQVTLSLADLFNEPTLAALAAKIDLLKRNQAVSPYNEIEPVDRKASFQLSFAQRALWFLDQWEPERWMFNRSEARRFAGKIDAHALEQSINRIVNRHESLRTRFPLAGDLPVQVIDPQQTIPLNMIDLSHLPMSEFEIEARKLASQEARLPFDLASGPILRTTIVKASETDHLLIVIVHHIASDGWSSGIFWNELATHYNAITTGTTTSHSILPIQYVDFSEWQHRHLQGKRLENLLSFWKGRIGTSGLPRLRLFKEASADAGYREQRGARQVLRVPQPVVHALRALGKTEDTSLFMCLLAAFKVMLFRYTGQTDIVVGTPIAGRNSVQLESMIGIFANVVPLRTDLGGNPTFRGLLKRVREVALQAYQNDDLPLSMLSRMIQNSPTANLGFPFEVMLNLRNFPTKPIELIGLQSAEFDFPEGKPLCPLNLEIMESSAGLSFVFEYDINRIDKEQMEQLLMAFQPLLETMVEDPDQPIGATRLTEAHVLQRTEKSQNGPAINDVMATGIHHCFEAQVKRTPNATAVCYEGNGLTYIALNRSANQLAHHLRRLGVRADARVGICVEKSLTLAVGLMGILKAGGAYVPIDPAQPLERSAFILDDTQINVILTQRRLLPLLPSTKARIVLLDDDWPIIEEEEKSNPISITKPEHLAYVLFTSGSTGRPKGVLVTHRGVINHTASMSRLFTLQSTDRVAQCTSLTFDISVEEIFPSWVSGAAVILCPPGEFLPGSELCRWMRDEEITVLNLPTSFWHEWVNELTRAQQPPPPSLRLLIVGGEKAQRSALTRWQQLVGNRCRWINTYGPTEATVTTTAFEATTEFAAGEPTHEIPIGRPITNCEAYILDRFLQPVPLGIAGEIHIGGDGLARGYLNRSELTAEKFIAHPFSEEPGARLYKTGDLARYLADGNIEFLGRLDNQVKIRGYRIELGEIESVLCQHPAINQAVVLAREDTPADKRLVGYVVSANGSAPSAHDLRSFLQMKLPEYMVPSAFVFLDSLPLTPNGKLDRKALPAPDQSRRDLEDAFASPRNPVEEILAAIWAEVLKLDQVGIHDNFFHLGGHSLLATQVVSRVNHSLQINLPLRRLFESPTIAGLADSIQASMAIENGSQSLQPIVPVPRSDDTPLSFAQERLWFLDQLDPDSPTYNMPAAFRLAGDLNVNALEQSLNEVARRHESLRTVFATANGNPVQQILPSLTFTLTPIDLSNHPESEREATLQSLIKEEALRPFDLSHGPLIRACLWRLAPDTHILALNLHHIISDGWSMGVLFRELSALYRGYCAGRSASLPELPVQYADYSVWQRSWLQGENLDIQLSYWKKQLEGLSTLQLPADRPRPPLQTYRGSSRSCELSTQLSRAIKGLGQRQGATLFMTLLAAFQTLLSRYSGQADIAVGSPIAGRTHREIEGLIGFFVNTLVLRTDLSNNPTFTELLRQVRDTTLEAYTHQDLPFEKLVEELHPERNPSISPLFQVLFILQNNADQPIEFERLAVSPLRTASQVAKFDLSLSMSERQGSLRASLNYNTDLFDASTIERMIGHFQVLLEAIVANPDQPISELPLLSETETHQILLQWNDTQTDYPKDKCIHQLFKDQVEKTPDAIALVFEDQQISYRELNHRANQLAQFLTKEGVQSGTAVGIYLDRSIELAVALLAVLKAGGVYVPIDPSYPSERINFMLQDVQAAVVVTTQSLASQLSLSGARILTLDTESEKRDHEDILNPCLIVGSQSPAYILYTSGSTGTPKGVVMSHRALANLISWQVSRFGQGLPARTLQFSPLGFDVSIQEMFSTWCSGGSLYLIRNELRQDGSALMKYIAEHSIERIFLPFVALEHLAEIALNEDGIPQRLREIVTAGEQLRLSKPIRLFLDRLGNCRLHNQYGPTESHVVTEYTVDPPFQSEPDLPPIGRPIANTQIYLLDAHLNPMPIGVTGEIHIGGAGVAMGYFNRPELTAEKFIANPFSSDPESRLYKTGDLARYLPDGNIEFLGRIDNQFKIRGYRIEPGEIETVLVRHPAVQQAVVLAREDTPEDKRLVAYCVPTGDSSPLPLDLRSSLQRKLPDYMVPSAFVFLESLPLSPNGKLDRKSLQAPDHSRPELDHAFTPPRTPLEELLANIWSEVLKLDKVGIHDNFFHLGGHSLMATQLQSRIQDAFKLQLPLRSLFEAPTIDELARRLQELGAKQQVMQEAAITPVARERYRIKQIES